MPPVLGPVSPSPTRLWSCAEPNGTIGLAVGQGEEADLLAFMKLLDHDRLAGAAEAAVEHRVERGLGLGLRSRR